MVKKFKTHTSKILCIWNKKLNLKSSSLDSLLNGILSPFLSRLFMVC